MLSIDEVGTHIVICGYISVIPPQSENIRLSRKPQDVADLRTSRKIMNELVLGLLEGERSIAEEPPIYD